MKPTAFRLVASEDIERLPPSRQKRLRLLKPESVLLVAFEGQDRCHLLRQPSPAPQDRVALCGASKAEGGILRKRKRATRFCPDCLARMPGATIHHA
jgi:hypothetical protein